MQIQKKQRYDKGSWLSTLIVKAKCFSLCCITFWYLNFLLHRRFSLHESLGKAWNDDSLKGKAIFEQDYFFFRWTFFLIIAIIRRVNWRGKTAQLFYISFSYKGLQIYFKLLGFCKRRCTLFAKDRKWMTQIFCPDIVQW